MAKAAVLMVGAFLLSAGVTYVYIHTRPVPPRPTINPNTPTDSDPKVVAPVPKSEIPALVAAYKPAEDRSAEMQVFDKAILFLSAMQESDGHWSAARSGASPEFANVNGDITLTALITAALLDACSFSKSNPEALARAKKGIEWLNTRVRADGAIADEAATGEPVAAQLYAALTLLQAGDLSSRSTVRDNATKLCRYAVASLQAEPGGFGASKGAKATRADLTALATVMFSQARAASVPIHELTGKTDEAETKLENDAQRKLERSIRNALQALRTEPKTEGRLALSSDKLEPSWDATVAGLLIDAAFVVQGPEVDNALDFILGAHFDSSDPAKANGFPGIALHVKWGEKGAGFSSSSLHNGSWMIFYVFGTNLPVWAEWNKCVNETLTQHQSPDGGFDVAGADATLGRFYRTATCARVLALLAPPPAPPQPTQSTPPSK